MEVEDLKRAKLKKDQKDTNDDSILEKEVEKVKKEFSDSRISKGEFKCQKCGVVFKTLRKLDMHLGNLGNLSQCTLVRGKETKKS